MSYDVLIGPPLFEKTWFGIIFWQLGEDYSHICSSCLRLSGNLVAKHYFHHLLLGAAAGSVAGLTFLTENTVKAMIFYLFVYIYTNETQNYTIIWKTHFKFDRMDIYCECHCKINDNKVWLYIEQTNDIWFSCKVAYHFMCALTICIAKHLLNMYILGAIDTSI